MGYAKVRKVHAKTQVDSVHCIYTLNANKTISRSNWRVIR